MEMAFGKATIPLLSGNYEYKYSADTWTIQEMNDPNASCTNGDPVYTNRTLTVGTSDITIPLVLLGKLFSMSIIHHKLPKV